MDFSSKLNDIIDFTVSIVQGLMSWGGLVVIVTLAFSIGLIWVGLNGYIQADKSKSWPSTDGLVVISYASEEVDSSSYERIPYYVPNISYDYTIDDRQYYGGSQKGLEVSKYQTREEAEAVIAKFPKGGTVPVYYKLGQPSESVLELGALKSNSGIFLSFGIFFLLLVSIFIVMFFITLKK